MTTTSSPVAFPGTERFRPLSLVGRGSMGTVYRVHDAETGSVVALKTLRHRAPEELYRLKSEFRALAGIVHPNLVQLYDLFVEGDLCFFTMEYVDGCDFVAHVRAGAAPVERFGRVALQLLLGLAALHGTGRLHRDVKPPNVLVAGGEVKLLDFDLSLIATGAATGQGVAAGSIAYMAPEQGWGSAISGAADVYAAAVVFYEALTGELPFDGPPAQLLADKASRPAPRLRSRAAVPPWVDDVVARMLDAEPAQRPPLAELLDAFGAAADEAPTVASAPWVRRRETEFVGREAELRRLQAAYDDFRGGSATLVHVHGLSGIGKTELLRQHTGHLQAQGALVLGGRCHPQESVPYKALDPVVDALSLFLLESAGEALAELTPPALNALARLFPVLGRVPAVAAARRRETVDAFELRQRGFQALRSLLARIGAARPLVVWIDDMQWGDVDSAVLLRELLSPPQAPRVLLLVSYRTEDRDRMAVLPILREMASGDDAAVAREIEIGPLSPADAQRLATQLCDRAPLDGSRLAAIVSQSGGSPFFIAEMSRRLAAGGDEAVGMNLAEVTLQRLRALPAQARRIAEVAAVAAAPIDRSLLLQAAECGEAQRPLVALLESECIMRSATTSGSAVVQTYHDRIREAVEEQLSAADKARCHLRLGTTFESLGRAAEPELLARHFHGAGVLPKAADYAVAAADKAADAFAFVRAAGLYRSAREWDARAAAWQRTLLTREGDALANATRFVDGARAFLAAAEGAPRLEALELRRNAAEHLISAGSVEQGVETLGGVLTELGMRYPRTPTTAMLSIGAGLVKLRLRGLRPRERRDQPTTEDLLRVDTCYSAAKSLVDADSIRGVYFSMQALQRALDAGDPIRLGRSLAILGGSLSVFPGAWVQRLGKQMFAQAEEIAAETGSPLLRGTLAVAGGQVLMIGGHWRDSLERLDDGVRLLTEQSRGAAFEALVGRTMALRSLEELGELGQVEQRAQDILRISRALGNRYAEIAVSDHFAGALIVRGETAAARRRARENLDLWTTEGFHLQHLYSIRRELLCDLYDGQAAAAYARLLHLWQTIRRSQLLQVSLPRVDVHWLRARLALAAGGAEALRDAARCEGKLAREGRPDADVYALLVRIAFSLRDGDEARAAMLLTQVVQRTDAVGMRAYAAAARYRRARLAGGENEDRDRSAASGFTQECGVVDPERWAMVYAPVAAA